MPPSSVSVFCVHRHPAFLGMVKHLCSWEVVNEFCIFLCLLSCPSLNPRIFSLLPLPILSPIPPRVSEWAATYQGQFTTRAKWDFANDKDANLSMSEAVAGNMTPDKATCRARKSREEQRGSRQYRQKTYNHSQSTRLSLQVYSVFSLPLLLLQPSLDHLHEQKIHCSFNVSVPWKKKPNQKPSTSDHDKLLSRRNSQSHLAA